MNWYRIAGAIALLWGAGVIISFFLRTDQIGGGASGAGQYAGVGFGFILFFAGLYAVITGGRPKQD